MLMTYSYVLRFFSSTAPGFTLRCTWYPQIFFFLFLSLFPSPLPSSPFLFFLPSPPLPPPSSLPFPFFLPLLHLPLFIYPFLFSLLCRPFTLPFSCAFYAHILSLLSFHFCTLLFLFLSPSSFSSSFSSAVT